MVNRQVTLSFNNATSEAACDITLFNELKVKKNPGLGGGGALSSLIP